MRLLICAGASGGGVYPALAALQALANKGVETMWVGGQGGMDAELVHRAGVPFEAIPAAGVHGVGPRRLPGNLVQLGRGYLAARRLLKRFQPDVLFFTGGYVAVPMALAGRAKPILLFVPDIEPGLALKWLARFADRIAVTAENSRKYFPSRAPVTVTGYPTRSELAGWDQNSARKALDLDPEMDTLLVFGGSKGARSINQALQRALETLLARMQVIHISGSLDWPVVEAAQAVLVPELAARYRPFAYLHDRMGAALAAADLVLARAGASTLGEFPLYGLPAILVPYPHTWLYQQVNARYLAERGAALVLPDEKLPDLLESTVLGLMEDSGRRRAMGAAMQRLSHPQAAAKIAGLLAELGEPARP